MTVGQDGAVALADFVVGPLLGEGPVARVHRARHTPSGADVALKLWYVPGATDEDRAAFLARTRTLRGLAARPARLVRHRWAGTGSGLLWLAMDLADGTLAQTEGQDVPDVDRGLDLADDVLDGLALVHGAGLVHGSVGPGDVLLVGGRALLGGRGMLPVAPPDTGGTTLHVAPEALRGGPSTPRSDVWSVARTVLDLLPADLPGALDRVLTRATSFSPDDRPQDAAALRAMLREARPAVPLDADRAVVVTVSGRRRTVRPGGRLVVGRGDGSDLQVVDAVLSRRHAAVERTADGWAVVDLGSAHGVWDGSRKVPVALLTTRGGVRLGGPDGVRLDVAQPAAPEPSSAAVERPPVTAPPVGEVTAAADVRPPVGPPPAPVVPAPGGPRDRAPAWRPSGGERLVAVHELRPGTVALGRSRGNDVVLDDLLVSRRHAELTIDADGTVMLRDLGSANGTHVNGRAVDRAVLVPGDLVTVGPHLLWLDGTALRQYDESSGVRLTARDVTVDLGARRLVDSVSLDVPARTLMAIVGPSGAGKSTLLAALAGLRPATSGLVEYAGRDLYAEYSALRTRIGFVPQQDILHQVLTVEQALGYGAALRFPTEVTSQEREARVREVLGELRLEAHASTRIGSLSGGQRKRASTALELLTKPSLLFLDEPTSGLDTDLDREVMQRLRALADDGRTVVVVTHNLEHLDGCDLVMVLAEGGHVAYLGPPSRAFGYFGVGSWADLFAILKMRAPAEWGARFRGSPDAATVLPAPTSSGRAVHEAPDQPVAGTRSGAAQMRTLVRRQLAVIGSDRTLLAILALLPVVLALIARVIPAEKGTARVAGNVEARQLLLVLVVGACLMGAAGSIRELVKERDIYRRERAAGLSASAYLAAKLVVASAIGALQAMVLTTLSLVGRPHAADGLLLPDQRVEIGLVIAAVTVVSAVLGLLVSAAVQDENQAMPVLVLMTMAQLVLSGGLTPIAGRAVLEQLSWLLPSRWGLAAVGSTVDLTFLQGPAGDVDPLWRSTTPALLRSVAVLLLLGVLAGAGTRLLLRRLDPRRSSRP